MKSQPPENCKDAPPARMSLRISLTVTRCATPDRTGRVRYQHGDGCLIAEQVVLRRWKERSKEPTVVAAGVRFDGCRLPSGTWTLLRQWIEEGLPPAELANPAVLTAHAQRNRMLGSELRTPESTKFAALIRFLLEKDVLRQVVGRRRSSEKPGLPDLFLYRVDREGRVHGGRFVEVKRRNRRRRTRERVSQEQQAELDFLKGLGLAAQVVYLLE